jgi:hypothetical protein
LIGRYSISRQSWPTTVADNGAGFTFTGGPPTPADLGRGRFLVAALSDPFDMCSGPGEGTPIRFQRSSFTGT